MTQSTPQHSVGRSASADAAIRLMHEAAEANLASPYRTGALEELPSEGDILVSGDLHGKMDNFRAVVDRADLYAKPKRHLVLQELVHEEDLPRSVDACTSYRLVEVAARLKMTFGPRVHVLFGNHEFAELCDLAIGKHGRELKALFDTGLQRAYGDRWAEVKAAYKAFWRTMPLALVTAHRAYIAHSTPDRKYMDVLTRDYLAGLAPGEDLARKKPPFRLLWGRDYSPEAADQFAEQMQADLFIVAHTPCENGYSVPSHRHIVLDSSSPTPCVLHMPLDRPVTQEQALKGLVYLFPKR